MKKIGWSMLVTLVVVISLAFSVVYANASSTGNGVLDSRRMSSGDIIDYLDDSDFIVDKGEVHTISMSEDWAIDDPIIIPEGTTITFNMNGHMLSRSDSDDYRSDGCLFFMEKGSSLIIEGGTDQLTHNVRGYIQSNKGDRGDKFSINGAVITGGANTSGGGAIHMDSSNISLTINDTKIVGNRAEQSWRFTNGFGGAIWINGEKCEVRLNRCLLSRNWSYNDGGAIYSDYDNAKVVLNETEIKNNYACDEGGAIGFDNKGTIKGINGSVISDNYGQDDGGGIYCDDTSCVVSGLEISGNGTDGNGGGIYFRDELCSVSDCIIKNNHGIQGGGIYINDDSNTISACTIENNTAQEGGGVYVNSDVDYKFSVTGKTFVRNNTANESKAANFYLSDSDSDDSKVNATVSKGSELHIGLKDPKADLTVSSLPGSYITKYIISDNSGYYFALESRMLVLKKGKAPEELPINVVNPAVESVGDYNGYPLYRGYFTHPDVETSDTDTDCVFFYSDGFFEDSAENYNVQLATTSLEMAMAGMYLNTGGTSDYSNKHAAIRQFMADIGCDDQDIYVNDFNTQKPGKDTIGVTISQKVLKDKNGQDTDTVLVPIAVRGGGYESEWVSNVTLGTSGEAAGFSSAASQTFAEIQKYIKNYGLEEKVTEGKVKFWISGYSRAGATANLTAKRLVDKYCLDNTNQVYGYTCEAPKGGREECELAEANGYTTIHNMINYADLVPLVAPEEMGFKRYGVDHYIPGGEAGSVKENDVTATRTGEGEIDLTLRSDNNPWETDSNEYKNQSNLMRRQLAAIDSSMIFDDYFHLANIDYVAPGISNYLFNYSDFIEEVDGDSVTVEKWIRDFMGDLQNWSLVSRNYYANTKTVIGDKEYNTIQAAVADAMGIVFGGGDSMTEVLDSLSSIDPGFDVISIYFDVIGDWDELDRDDKQYYLNKIWNMLESAGGMKNLSESQRALLEKDWPTLADMLLTFMGKDYKTELYNTGETQVHLGTAAYNLSRVITAHYPEINLAWARTYDSLYADEETTGTISKEYDILLPNKEEVGEIAATAVETDGASAEEITETNVDGGNNVTTVSGSQKLILDVVARGGEAIYYTIKKNNESTSSLQIYRGGVSLQADQTAEVEYTITAYPKAYGVKGAEQTFKLKLLPNQKKLTVVTTDENVTYWREGEQVTVTAELPSDQFFKNWKAEKIDESGATDVTGDLLVNNGQSIASDRTISFKMPAYELKLTAEYGSKISDIDIELESPISGDTLGTAMISAGDKSLESSTAWSYLFHDTEVMTSGTAFDETEYKAIITLSGNRSDGVVFADSVSAKLNGKAIDNRCVDVNPVNGSVTITLNYDVTEDSGSNPKPESIHQIIIKEWDTNVDKKEGTELLSGVEGKTITLTAPEVEDEMFISWNLGTSGITLIDGSENDKTISFIMPQEKVSITADYIPLIHNIDVTMKEPVVGEKMATGIESFKVKITKEYYLDPSSLKLTWSPELQKDGYPEYEKVYTAKIALKNADTIDIVDDEGVKVGSINCQFAFADNISATVNGKMAEFDNNLGTVIYTFDKTDSAAILESVGLVDGITVERGTVVGNITSKLPSKIEISVMDRSVTSADIVWDYPREITETGDYTAPRFFEVNGIIKLPDGVTNPNKISLEVSTLVTMRGATQTETPVASFEGGTYDSPIDVKLKSMTADAVIYYTLDGSTPTEESMKYSSPIQITRKADNSTNKIEINAVAYKEGYQKSVVSTYVYTITNEVSLPKINDRLKYTGDKEIGVYGSDDYVLISENSNVTIDTSGNAVAINPGTYTVTAKLKEGLVWKDDAISDKTADRTVIFTIAVEQGSPAEGEGYDINYSAQTIKALDGYEISSSAETFIELNKDEVEPGKTYYVRKSPTEDMGPSMWTAIEIPQRPAAVFESVFTKKIESCKHNQDATLLGVTTAMEYRFKGDSQWISGTGEEIKNPYNRDIEVRTKATDTAFAGMTSTVSFVAPNDTYSTTWTSDETNHWHACTVCGAMKDVAAHTLVTTTTKATATMNGIKVTKCSVCNKVTKTTTIYAAKTIKLSNTTFTYDGKVKRPTVIVKDSLGNTISTSNYTVTYSSGCKKVGKYTVKITFKGNYSGSKTLTFRIIPPKTSISKLTAGSKSFKVQWSKKTTQTTGYQIQYSTSSTFMSGNKTVTIKSNKTTSQVIKKLKGKKKYYVRIRMYKTVSGVKYYSAWSVKKTVTTKK